MGKERGLKGVIEEGPKGAVTGRGMTRERREGVMVREGRERDGQLTVLSMRAG